MSISGFTNGDYFTHTKTLSSVATLSIAVWAYPTSLADYMALTHSRTDNLTGIILTGRVSRPMTFCYNGSASEYDATTGLFLTTNAWNFCGGAVDTSDGYSTVYHADAGGALNSYQIVRTFTTIASLTNWYVGQDFGGGGRWFLGKLAEVALWTVKLSADEFASLAKGYSPLLVRPQALVFYLPMVRQPLQELRGAQAMTITGTLTDDTHPPIIRPRGIYMPGRASFVPGAWANRAISIAPVA